MMSLAACCYSHGSQIQSHVYCVHIYFILHYATYGLDCPFGTGRYGQPETRPKKQKDPIGRPHNEDGMGVSRFGKRFSDLEWRLGDSE